LRFLRSNIDLYILNNSLNIRQDKKYTQERQAWTLMINIFYSLYSIFRNFTAIIIDE